MPVQVDSINYKNIIRAFWLELPDHSTGCFVIGFDKPLIQGQTDYKYTIIQFKKNEDIEVEMGPRYDEIPKINENISRTLVGPFFEKFTEIFKVFTGIGVVTPGDFKNSKGDACLPCSVGAKSGYLYLLNKSLIFILRPVIYVKYDEVAKAVFHRVTSGHTARGFDLEILTKAGTSYSYSGLDKADFDPVLKFMKERGVLTEAAKDEEIVKVTKTAEEWKKTLDAKEYHVLREKGTERAFTGRYHDNHEKGTYTCAGCGLELFNSDAKFESGTGWPSFFQPLKPSRVTEIKDTAHGMVRTEVVCARCEGHLGHVFDDGPKPTGLRYCMNGTALKFTKVEEKK